MGLGGPPALLPHACSVPASVDLTTQGGASYARWPWAYLLCTFGARFVSV